MRASSRTSTNPKPCKPYPRGQCHSDRCHSCISRGCQGRAGGYNPKSRGRSALFDLMRPALSHVSWPCSCVRRHCTKRLHKTVRAANCCIQTRISASYQAQGRLRRLLHLPAARNKGSLAHNGGGIWGIAFLLHPARPSAAYGLRLSCGLWLVPLKLMPTKRSA